MNRDSRIFVTGHRGLVGSAIVKQLKKDGFSNVITRTKDELNLTQQTEVERFFTNEQPEYVFASAARVGGILDIDSNPADFIYLNTTIQNNVIYQAHKSSVKKLLFIGSTCIYPRNAPQPLKEEYIMTDKLEPTVEYYGIAKIAGIKMCEAFNKQYGSNFISCIPTNLYGPIDNFDNESGNVIPSLISRFHKAKVENRGEVVVWGTGNASREFMHVDEFVRACIFIMMNYSSPDFINIGTGRETTIKELAEIIKNVVNYTGSVVFDKTKPDGVPRKVTDVSKLEQLGWKNRLSLEEGIRELYLWYTERQNKK